MFSSALILAVPALTSGRGIIDHNGKPLLCDELRAGESY